MGNGSVNGVPISEYLDYSMEHQVYLNKWPNDTLSMNVSMEVSVKVRPCHNQHYLVIATLLQGKLSAVEIVPYFNIYA